MNYSEQHISTDDMLFLQPETGINEMLIELEQHESFVILQRGSDIWLAEKNDESYNFLAGYWPATATGFAQATDVLQSIN